jgi:hypothetical protein
MSFARCMLGVCSVQPVQPSDWRRVVLLLEIGTWARSLTQSPELGFRLSSFLFLERFCFCAAVATVVLPLLCNGSYTSPLSHRRCINTASFSRGRHDGSPVLSATLRQFQAPAPEIAVHPERTQNVLVPLHQQGAQIRIALFADMHLRLALPRVSSSWLQPVIAAHVAALAETMRIFQRQQGTSARSACLRP